MGEREGERQQSIDNLIKTPAAFHLFLPNSFIYNMVKGHLLMPAKENVNN